MSSGFLYSCPYVCPSLFSLAPARVVFGAMHAEDPGELASLVRIFQTPRCKSRRSVMEGREESHEEEERRATELDWMVKRAEDGRCLVVCRIWVSDLGLRPAVGRLVRQETCFLGRLSFSSSPLVPTPSAHVLSSRSLSLRSSR